MISIKLILIFGIICGAFGAQIVIIDLIPKGFYISLKGKINSYSERLVKLKSNFIKGKILTKIILILAVIYTIILGIVLYQGYNFPEFFQFAKNNIFKHFNEVAVNFLPILMYLVIIELIIFSFTIIKKEIETVVTNRKPYFNFFTLNLVLYMLPVAILYIIFFYLLDIFYFLIDIQIKFSNYIIEKYSNKNVRTVIGTIFSLIGTLIAIYGIIRL
jgi:hypothetical protein